MSTAAQIITDKKLYPTFDKPVKTDPAIESHTKLALLALMAHFDCPSNLTGYIGVYVGLANDSAEAFECPDYEAGRLYRGKRTKANPSQRTVENRVRKMRPKMNKWQDATGIVFVEATEGAFSKETNKQGPTQIRVPCLPVIKAIRKAITARLADDPDADIRTVRKVAEEITAATAGDMGKRAPRPKNEKPPNERTAKTMLRYVRTYGARALGSAIEPGNVALAAIGYDDPDFEVIPFSERHARLLATLKTMYAEAEKRGIAGDFLNSLPFDHVPVNPDADPGTPVGLPASAIDPDIWIDELCTAEGEEAARIRVELGDHSYVAGIPKTLDSEFPKEASNVEIDETPHILPSADNRELEENGVPSPPTIKQPSELTQHDAWRSPLTLAAFALYTMLPEPFLASVGIGMWPDHTGREYLCIPHFDVDGTLLGMKQRANLHVEPRFIWVEGSAQLYGAEWAFQEARQRPALIICEGITDQLTFRYHGMPAVGLSGASDYRALRAEHLQGIANVIICRDNDDAGMDMAWNLTNHLREQGRWDGVYVMKFDKAKDASEVHKHVNGDHTAFKDVFDQAYADAISMTEVI